MVRGVVKALAHAAAGVHGVAVLARQHQRRDARDLGAVGEHLQIEHHVQVLLERIGNARGRLRQLDAGREPRVDVQDAPLDLANLV